MERNSFNIPSWQIPKTFVFFAVANLTVIKTEIIMHLKDSNFEMDQRLIFTDE